MSPAACVLTNGAFEENPFVAVAADVSNLSFFKLEGIGVTFPLGVRTGEAFETSDFDDISDRFCCA